MNRFRVIPALLLKDGGLVKTVRFKNPKYIGDPINAVKIFNEKEVDELMFLDIEAGKKNKDPDYKLISEIAGECFMPLSYGGGIRTMEQIKKLLYLGVEKIVINSHAFKAPNFIKEATNVFGGSTIVGSIDVKKDWLGKSRVYICGGTKNTNLQPLEAAKFMEEMGVGEIVINSIDKDGTMKGYDVELIKSISNWVNIPVVALGGAGKSSDFREAIFDGNASAVAAGSMFVYHGINKAVLISYPSSNELEFK